MSAFTQQINAQTGGVLRFPTGVYVIDQPVTVKCVVLIDAGSVIQQSAQITMSDNSSWHGVGNKITMIKSGAINSFVIAGSNVSIQNLLIDDTQAATAGWAFLIDTAAHRERIYIEHIITMGSFGLIADNSLPGIIVNLHVTDVTSRLHRGRGSYLTKTFAYNYFDTCTIDYINTTNLTAANIPVWVFFNAEGLKLKDVDVTGNATNGNMTTQWGFYFENCSAISLDNVGADTTGGSGFSFKNCNWVYGNRVKSGLCGAQCFIFSGGTQNVFIEGFYAQGRKGLPFDPGAGLFYADARLQNVNFNNGMTQNADLILDGSANSIKFSNRTDR